MLQHHGGAHQGIVRHRQHRPCGGRQYRGSLLSGDVHAVVGTPISQSRTVYQLLHGKSRQHIPSERGHHQTGCFRRHRRVIHLHLRQLLGFLWRDRHRRRLQSLHCRKPHLRHFHRLRHGDLRRHCLLRSRVLPVLQQEPSAHPNHQQAHRQRAVKTDARKYVFHLVFHTIPPFLFIGTEGVWSKNPKAIPNPAIFHCQRRGNEKKAFFLRYDVV